MSSSLGSARASTHNLSASPTTISSTRSVPGVDLHLYAAVDFFSTLVQDSMCPRLPCPCLPEMNDLAPMTVAAEAVVARRRQHLEREDLNWERDVEGLGVCWRCRSGRLGMELEALLASLERRMLHHQEKLKQLDGHVGCRRERMRQLGEFM